MKKNVFLLLLMGCIVLQAQEKMTIESATYLNGITVAKIPRFIELHKKFTDMSMGPNRKITGDWLFRHWYGAGHTFVIYQQFENMQDYHADGDIAEENIRNAMKALAKKEKDTVLEEWKEYRSFADGHTDEIRGAYSSTGFETVENVNFDVPFVMTVGRYNSTGSWAEMGNAFFDWSIKPSIESGKSIAGGVSYHYMGSGPEVEVWLCYNSLIDFAEAVSTASNDSSTAKSRKQFWDLAEAQHEDQIYLHIGHVDLEKSTFDLAGADR